MHHFIDRRANPKGKSLGNRQRFLERARDSIKERVDRSVREKSIKDGGGIPAEGEKVTIPSRGFAFTTLPRAGADAMYCPATRILLLVTH